MNDRRAFRVSRSVVERMSLLTTLDVELVRHDLRPGRPRGLTVGQLFTLLIVMTLTKRPPHLTEVVIVFENLHWSDRRELGLESLTIHQVRHLLDRLRDLLAIHMNVSRNRPGKSTADNPMLQRLLDEFAAASDAVSPEYRRDLAIDGTRLPVGARARSWVLEAGRKTKQPTYADPDITFHSMEGRSGYNSAQGYGMTSIVTVAKHKVDDPPQTTLIFSVADMTMTYTQEGVLGEPLLDRLPATLRGATIHTDTGYSDYKNFRTAVLRNGLNPSMSLHSNHQSTHDTWDGVVAAADTLVCPGTPATLLSIRGVNGEDLSRLATERASYELRQHGKRTDAGNHRYTCPARAGKIRCPLYGPSMRLPASTPTVAHPPQARHKVCTQQTVTLPSYMLTFLQQHPVGTQAHATSFGHRNTVESGYNQLKSSRSGGLKKDSILLRGLVAYSLLLSCVVVAENVRRVERKLSRHTSASIDDHKSLFGWVDQDSPVIAGLLAHIDDHSPPWP